MMGHDPARAVYLNRVLPEVEGWLERGPAGRLKVPAGSPRDFFLHLREDRFDEAVAAIRGRPRRRGRGPPGARPRRRRLLRRCRAVAPIPRSGGERGYPSPPRARRLVVRGGTVREPPPRRPRRAVARGDGDPLRSAFALSHPQRIAVTVPIQPGVEATLEHARWAEEEGFDDVWFSRFGRNRRALARRRHRGDDPPGSDRHRRHPRLHPHPGRVRGVGLRPPPRLRRAVHPRPRVVEPDHDGAVARGGVREAAHPGARDRDPRAPPSSRASGAGSTARPSAAAATASRPSPTVRSRSTSPVFAAGCSSSRARWATARW